MTTKFALGGAVLSLIGSAAAAEMTHTAATYDCARGALVSATYVTDADGALAVLMVEGRQIVLWSESAASGTRYGWPSDGSNYVWWTKGDEATLFWRDGPANTEEVILADCKARS